jgi:alkylation response protein AidB-like acyl-CoA dehydrogenase
VNRLTETDGLTEAQRDILAAVREFVDTEILPVATELDHADEYPGKIVAGLQRLGLFGLYGDAPLLLIGEGTAEIQKMIIGNRLIGKHRIP